MLKKAEKLEQLILGSSNQVTDGVLAQLEQLPNLKVVDLYNSFTDKISPQLEYLPSTFNPVDIYNSNKNLTDAGWVAIKKLQERKILTGLRHLP